MKSQGKIKLAREIAGRTVPRFVAVQTERDPRRAPKYILSYMRVARRALYAGDDQKVEWCLEQAIRWAEGK